MEKWALSSLTLIIPISASRATHSRWRHKVGHAVLLWRSCLTKNLISWQTSMPLIRCAGSSEWAFVLGAPCMDEFDIACMWSHKVEQLTAYVLSGQRARLQIFLLATSVHGKATV